MEEKQIREIARFIWDNSNLEEVGMIDYIAEKLYNAGYRKQSEVAKEIFDALDEYIKTLRTESQKRIKYDDTDYYKGKCVASDEVAWFIRTVLEKKYLEERV